MKNTGMVRKIDDLGRIVIPKEIRKSLEIQDNEEIEIYIDEDRLVLRPCKTNQNRCVMCDNEENLKSKRGIAICRDCLKEFSE